MKRNLFFLLKLATNVDTVRSVQVLLTAFMVILPGTKTYTKGSILRAELSVCYTNPPMQHHREAFMPRHCLAKHPCLPIFAFLSVSISVLWSTFL
ncbi:hypothetical protein F5146DRAFT_720189 [Armillaria mellea]|nr:hypothetical protein F5146DRAFT_720189 [Armillaria mellea]